jgi:hypothetical protein
MQIATIEIFALIQFAQSVPSRESPYTSANRVLSGGCKHTDMFGKCADTRKKGASGTTKLAVHRRWAKRRRKPVATHLGLEIGASIASQNKCGANANASERLCCGERGARYNALPVQSSRHFG